MKEVSKYLIDFLKSNFIHKQSKHWKSQNTMFSTPFIKNVFSKIKDADAQWLKIKDTIVIKPIDFKKDGLPKGPNYEHLNENIRMLLEKREKMGKQYMFSIGEQHISIYIIYPFSEDDPVMSVCQKKADLYFMNCLHKCYLWLYMASKERQNECSQQMNIYLYLSELHKLLPEESESMLEDIHANTAFTTSCIPSTCIHLFREEEWFKVFIHESFHCLGFDFSHSRSLSEYSKRKVLELFPVKSDVNLFETYCEVMAELYNIFFFVYLENPTIENIPPIIKRVNELFLYEKTFSVFQCVKVLNHFGMKYHNLYSNDKESISLRTQQYKEKTNILAYYILKSIMISNMEGFLQWTETHNKGGYKFIETEENLDSYIHIITSHYTSDIYLSNVKIMESWFLKHGDSWALENRTMRLSVVE